MPSPLEVLQKAVVASAFGEPAPELLAELEGGGRLDARAALGVYVRGYSARMSEALGETFEACWRVLGDEDFLAACAAYARARPSTSHNLSDYGAGFPELLLARHGSHAPFIGALGRLEWELKELFHAPAHEGLPPAELAAKAGPRSRLVLGSAARLLAFPYRVHSLWRRDRADETPLEPADWAGDEFALLYKSGGPEVRSRALSAGEHAALSALRRGRTLEDALASAAGLDEAGAAELFRFIAEERLVSGFAICDSPDDAAESRIANRKA